MIIKLKEALQLAAARYEYRLNNPNGKSSKKYIRLSGKSGLHGGDFFDKWNKIYGLK